MNGHSFSSKDRQLNLRLSEGERELVRTTAERSGKSVSELIRELVAKEASRLECAEAATP